MLEVNYEPEGIELDLSDLAPLLAPYAEHRELSFKIEQVPKGASLSKGRKSSDHEWSLTRDELDKLIYFPPTDKLNEKHTLAIRVSSHDGDSANCLAVFFIPISAGEAQNWAKSISPVTSAAAPEIAAAAAAPEAVPAPEVAYELVRKAKEIWKDEEADRAAEAKDNARALLEEKLSEYSNKMETALEDAHSAHSREIDKQSERHKKTMRMQEGMAESRHATELEAAERNAKSLALREFDERLLEVKKDAEYKLKEAREIWDTETDTALKEAKIIWRAGEADRLTAARAEWHEHAQITKTSFAVGGVAKSRRRSKFWRRFRGTGAFIACAAALYIYYPSIKPMVTKTWWPNIVEFKNDSVRQVGKSQKELESWMKKR